MIVLCLCIVAEDGLIRLFKAHDNEVSVGVREFRDVPLTIPIELTAQGEKSPLRVRPPILGHDSLICEPLELHIMLSQRMVLTCSVHVPSHVAEVAPTL